MSRLRHPLTAVAAAAALAVPWLAVLGTGAALSTGLIVSMSGLAVLGASFLLAWAAETAEKDVPRSFALAVLAVLAVAPEYAVDALYAWTAGSQAGTARGIEAGNLAVANMTGANRILIGIGWAGIALFTVWQARKTADPAVEERAGWGATVVHLDRDIATEIVFLLAATAWAFMVPFGGGIDAIDMVVLVGLYVAYIGVILKSGMDPETDHVGVPKYLQHFRRSRRIPTVIGLFAFSGMLILTAVEPFAHGLEDIGVSIGVPPFFMIQWIAPLASESPELIVVAVLVMKARSTAGFNTLISSKLNQWTLLIGTLVVVYSLGLGEYGALPFDREQDAEIWLTAAQSLFAIALLVDFKLSVREAIALFVLFISQVLIEFIFLKVWEPFPDPKYELLLVYTALYLAITAVLLVRRRHQFRYLLQLGGFAVKQAMGRDPTRPVEPTD